MIKHNIDSKLIVSIIFLSVFINYFLTILILFFTAIYLALKTDILKNMIFEKRYLLLIIFSLYLAIISVVFHNWIGLILSFGMLLLFINLNYFEKNITSTLFEKLIDYAIYFSVIIFLVTLFEQAYIYSNNLQMANFFDIQNRPSQRVSAFYMNANYFALMIVFIEIFVTYKIILNSKSNKKYLYFLIGVINLVSLYLTGGRTAWLSLAIGVLLLLIFSGLFKTAIITFFFTISVLFVLTINPSIIPRLQNEGTDLGRRTKIYQTSLLIIKDTWLLGRGPLTYYHINDEYLEAYLQKTGDENLGKLGISSQHTHSIFLEPLVSFGVIGSIFISGYFISVLKDIIDLYRSRKFHFESALIISVIFSVLSFSIVDFPILWVQTGLLFMLIISYSRCLLNKK